jgi:hypothetical protein
MHRSWTTAEAATLLRELVWFRVWDDLVNSAQIAPARFTEMITTAVLATLAAPLRRGPRHRGSGGRV